MYGWNRAFMAVSSVILSLFLSIGLLWADPCPRCGSDQVEGAPACGVCGLEASGDRGHLMITSVPPGAQVFHLGEPIGETPIKRSNLKEGFYNLQVRKDGFFPERIRVQVTPRMLTSETVRLNRMPVERPPEESPASPEPVVETSPTPAAVETAAAAPAELPTRRASLGDFFSTATGSVMAPPATRGGDGSGLRLDPSLLEGSEPAERPERPAEPDPPVVTGRGRLELVLAYFGKGSLSPEVEVRFDGKVVGRPRFTQKPWGKDLTLTVQVPTGVHALEVRARGSTTAGKNDEEQVKAFTVAISSEEDSLVFHEWSDGIENFAARGPCCVRGDRRP